MPVSTLVSSERRRIYAQTTELGTAYHDGDVKLFSNTELRRDDGRNDGLQGQVGAGLQSPRTRPN